MNESILNTIKKLLGIESDYDAFDMDIIVLINSAFSVLYQVGAAPVNGFTIEGPTETWEDFIESRVGLEMVKAYIYYRVRLGFDIASSTSFAIAAYEKQAQELEWRLSMTENLFRPVVVVSEGTDNDLD